MSAIMAEQGIWDPGNKNEIRVWECARKLWETLRRRSQNLAIWASQRMLFDPTKTFCFFYIYFIAKVLCCFGIRTEEIQLTEPLRNLQVSKALVVAAQKIPLNVPNHRFELKFAYALKYLISTA